jgi:hypothetical protein
MANQPDSNDDFLKSDEREDRSDEREDSGLQDILAVAAKIKEAPSDEFADDQTSEREDSGMILFSAGDFGGEAKADDDDALFGSFAGGLAAGFGTPVEPISSPDLVPLGGEGSVSEARPAEVRPKPAEEPKRNPLTALAVVLGLGLVAAGVVYLTHEDPKPQPQQALAEMSANPDDDAAVGKAEPTPEEQASAGASAGAGPAVEPEPEPDPELLEGETEGAVLDGETDGLLAAGDTDGDPMAQKAGLLEAGSDPVAKSGKWDQGTSHAKPAADPVVADPEPDPDPDPDPILPEPKADPVKKPAGSEDDVECLLQPDLPKCDKGGASKPKDEEVLAPKLAEKLDSNALRSGFNSVKSKAKACGSKHGAEAGTKVKVHASIEGETGKVTSVSAQGEHAGTALGKCVEDAVKGATFDKFKHSSQGADYSMIM